VRSPRSIVQAVGDAVDRGKSVSNARVKVSIWRGSVQKLGVFSSHALELLEKSSYVFWDWLF